MVFSEQRNLIQGIGNANMANSNKKRIRSEFRSSVFQRAKYRCEYCGSFGRDRQGGDEHTSYHSTRHGFYGDNLVELDSHHITPREDMPNGGYCKQNGISLCDTCHIEAEKYLSGDSDNQDFSPERLYALIQSSHKEALQFSMVIQ